MNVILCRLLAKWVSRHPVDSHFVRNIVLFSMLPYCLFGQTLKHILDALFSIYCLSPPQRLPRGRGSELRVRRHAGDDGRGLSFPSVPSTFPFFPLPSLQTTSLHGQGSMKKASAEERD